MGEKETVEKCIWHSIQRNTPMNQTENLSQQLPVSTQKQKITEKENLKGKRILRVSLQTLSSSSWGGGEVGVCMCVCVRGRESEREGVPVCPSG